MARIPEAEIERLKAEVSVARLVESSGIELKKQGKDLAGRCPFHDDAEPSLIVSPDKNLWHCFGCQIGGGPIDWAMKRNGVSFRHAVELLREGVPSLAAGAVVKHSTVKVLSSPLPLDADDQALLNRTVDFYHQTLKQAPEALAYLQSRGLDHPELIDTFKLGFANRTLGLRLPEKNRKAGADIRARLERIGIYRESGHEHLAGSLVVPVTDEHDNATELYGRKITTGLRKGTPLHLYLPGPHKGVWNIAGLAASGGEIILCEALIDAMTFWCAGYRNVTAAYGVEGFTDDHLAAFARYGIKRVLIAYDRDDAGDRAADKLAPVLMAAGIECYRINFPKGMDANEYALKVTPAVKSLGVVIRKAAWMGKGDAPARPLREPDPILAAAVAKLDSAPPAAKEKTRPAPAASSAVETVAVPVAATAAPEAAPPLPASPLPSVPTADAEADINERDITVHCGPRRYRVRGFDRNLAVDVMKINMLATDGDGFHVDTLDLYSAKQRNSFIQQAAIELRVKPDTIKADLGKVLLKLEALQDERIQQTLQPEPEQKELAGIERDEALALLKAPDLLNRILADFDAAGLVGETTNKLVAYLATVSRKLAGPLAIVVQSSSAAGKSSLMDAVLAFVPEEERVKYSAMTGQSLFYMGETNLKHKILAICEEEGASRAAYALKLLQSDGELTIASTGKDPDTGNLITQQYKVVGPVMIFLTTTAIDVDEELLNRCLVLTVDEGREQTAAIHRLQRQKRTLSGLLAKEAKTGILQRHRNAQRLLRPLAVVNPYADQLTFLSDKTRTRRDHEKYLTLIDTIALLHQYQRPIKTVPGARGANGEARDLEYIEVTPADIEHANRLTHEVLGRSLDELPPQTRLLLSLVDGSVENASIELDMPRRDYRFSRRDVRNATGWGDTQLKIHLARLAELEYLLVHRSDRGQGYVYELLYDGGGSNAPHLSGLIDPAQLRDAHHYDMARSGQRGAQSALGREAVGGKSGDGRTDESAQEPLSMRVAGDEAQTGTQMHVYNEARPDASYLQAPLALAAVGA